MKPLTIKLNDPTESKVIESALAVATGKPQKINSAKYVFISEEGKVSFSNEDLIYQKNIEHNITVIDAVNYLESLVEGKPFLLRSGARVSITGKIDQGIKDQFAACCRHNGLKPDERLENLLAADIKCRIHGIDLIEMVKRGI